MQLYRIMWVDENGQKGNGERCLSLESATSWIIYLRSKYPEMKHWIK
jgi:hypothetical protein